MSEPETIAAPGDVLAGKYTIVRPLAEGGMGAVFEARDEELGRRVAIKLLKADNEKAVARFQREAKIAASLESEHAVRVFEVGATESELPFLVMEYLEGRDLGQELAERERLPVSEAVGLVLEVCEAVAEAHERGIVHRDLKPSNLFLHRRLDGSVRIKVLDFGISKPMDPSVASDAQFTETGATLGTPLYMSPEQLRNPRDADARTDLWALGLILYEAVAGELPWELDSLQSLGARIATEPPKSLRAIAPDAPEELETIVERCLEKKPERRYQSVVAFAEAVAPLGPTDASALLERIRSLTGASRRERASTLRSAGDVETESTSDEGELADDRAAAAGTFSATSKRPPSVDRRANVWVLVGAAAVIGLLALGSLRLLGDRPEPASVNGNAPAIASAPALPPASEPASPTLASASVAPPRAADAAAPASSVERPSVGRRRSLPKRVQRSEAPPAASVDPYEHRR